MAEFDVETGTLCDMAAGHVSDILTEAGTITEIRGGLLLLLETLATMSPVL